MTTEPYVLGTTVLADGSLAVLAGNDSKVPYSSGYSYDTFDQLQVAIIASNNTPYTLNQTTGLSFPAGESPNREINDSTGAYGGGDIAGLANGNIAVVTWGGTNTNYDLQILNSSGTVIKAPVVIADESAPVAGESGSNPHATVASWSGGFVVAWQQNNLNIATYQRYDNSGNSVGSPVTVAANTPDGTLGSDLWSGVMSVDSQGDVIFGFNAQDIYTQSSFKEFNSSNQLVSTSDNIGFDNRVGTHATSSYESAPPFTDIPGGGFITVGYHPYGTYSNGSWQHVDLVIQEVGTNGSITTVHTVTDAITNSQYNSFNVPWVTRVSSDTIVFQEQSDQGTTTADSYNFVTNTLSRHSVNLGSTPYAQFIAPAGPVSGSSIPAGVYVNGSNQLVAEGLGTVADQAPVVTASGGTTAASERSAIAIDGSITVSDADSANLTSATVSITGNFHSTEDTLGFTAQNGISGSYNSGTGVLTLSGSASVANYQAALRSVTYDDISHTPNTATRTISFSVNDGTLDSTIATKSVSVAAVDDAPVTTTSGGTTAASEQVPIAIDSGLTLSDVDSANLSSATVSITGGLQSGEDVLGFTAQNGITGSYNAATGVLTLTGSASVASYQAALRSVTYDDTSDSPSTAARTISFSVNDGTLNSTIATKSVSVAAVDDAPVTTTSGGTTAASEQAPIAIDSGLTLSDVDSANLSSATVSITGGLQSGEDVLGFTAQNGITGSYNAATGVLTLTGSASVASYQSALQSVTYEDTSDSPSTAARTISFSVNDGTLNSTVSTKSVSVAAVDDAPVATASGGTTAASEQVPIAIDSGLTLSDVDSANLSSATVSITGGLVSSEDVLGFTAQNGITGSYDAATGVLSLSGSASVASYQAALQSVTYQDTSDTPSTAARTISFSVNDGTLDSNVSTKSVSVAAVDDAPIVTASAGTTAASEQVPIAIDSGLTLSDVDSANLSSATVSITGGLQSGEDVLGFTAQNGITGSYDAATGVLSLSGSASVASYQAALQSVTYEDTADTPNTGTRTISFVANDGTLDSTTATKSVSVTAVDHAPVVTASAGTTAASEQVAIAIDSGLTLSDVDNATLASAKVQITGGFATGQDVLGFTAQNGITGSYNAATGVLTLTGSASVANYQAALRSVTYDDTSDAPSTAARTISFSVNDGTLDSTTATKSVSVAAVDDAPVTTTSAGTTAASEQVPIAIDGGLTLSDVDSATLSSASVSITGGFATGQDVLGFTAQNGITGSYNAATGVLTLTGSASVANYQAALRSVTYDDTSDAPSTAARTISFSVNDGTLDSTTATKSVSVAAVDDAPVTTTSAGTTAASEQVPIAIDGGLTLSDVDSATLSSASISITGGFATGQDVLGFTAQNGITGSYNAATGVLTLTGSASVANYQAALRSVTYDDTSDAPSTAARTISFSVNDGTLNSTVATKSVSVAAIDDAPVVTASAGTTAASEQVPVAVDSGLTLSDVDSANLSSATVSITGGFATGQDVLGFTAQNGITGSYNAATGVLTLTGSASIASYQAALRSVTYDDTSDTPSTTARTISFSVNDGTLNSTVSTKSVSVAAVDDAPVTTASAGTTAASEQVPVAVDSGLTLSDADSATLSSATVSITGGFATGQDVLGFTAQNGITGSYNATTGVLTLTGSASVASYQAALRSVTYDDTSDSPSTAARTISFSVNDGTLNSNVTAKSVSVAAVDDAPVVTASAGTTAASEQVPIAIDSSLTLSDVDNATLASAKVQITGGFAIGQDVLGFTAQNGITGSYNAATGVLTLTGSASVGNYQAALRSVTYDDTSDTPSTAARTISFSVNDGTLTSTVSTKSVSVAAVDDAPVTTTSAGTTAASEQMPIAIDSGLTLSDVDNATLASAKVQITGGFAIGQDVLGFTAQNGITGSYNAATGVLTLTGSASVASYQAALRSVTYDDTSDTPSTAARTISFSVNDGTLTSTVSTKSVSVAAVDDAPVATASAGTTAASEQVPIAIDSGLTLSDVDNATLASAKVQITGGFAIGQDVLGFTAQNGITGSYNATTGVLTLSGSASVASYQAALRSVTYDDTSDSPSTAARTISFSINDGTLSSAVSTKSVSVAAVDDAPVLAGTFPAAVSYIAHQNIALAKGVSISDVDNTTVSSATVTVTGGFVGDGDQLSVLGANGSNVVINGHTYSATYSGSGATEKLTISGTGSIADYDQLLDNVQFKSDSTDVAHLSRMISWSINDPSNLASNTISQSMRLTLPASDFNGDQTSDFLFRNNTTGDFGYDRLSPGGGATWTPLGGSSPTNTVDGVGDFNGDGQADVLFRNNSTGDFGYSRLNAGGTSATWTPLGGSSSAYAVEGVGDFNGDGRADILLRNNATGDFGYEAVNAGGTSVTWKPLGGSSATFTVEGVGDFNGDGRADILFRNNSTGDLGVDVMGTGGNSVTWTPMGGSSSAYKVEGVGYFDASGLAEALMRNDTTGEVGYEQFTGTGNIWHDLGPSNATYKVEGVGDYNGNGISDILFRSPTTGDVGYYNVSSSGGLAWVRLPAASTAYDIVG